MYKKSQHKYTSGMFHEANVAQLIILALKTLQYTSKKITSQGASRYVKRGETPLYDPT